jgi:chemotaxis protein MotB
MSRRKRHEEHDNHEAWAIPYGDLVTLLLAFFVVMYAMSTVNEGKYRVLSDSLSEAFNGAPHAPRAVSDADGTGTRVELPRSQVRRLISAELPGLPVSSA